MTAVLNASAPHRPTAFDVCGELPTGTTVLEASAGTGGEPTRFGDLALRLWRPLLAAEVLR